MNKISTIVIFLLSLAMIKTPLFQVQSFGTSVLCSFFLSLCMFLSIKEKDKFYSVICSGIFASLPNIIALFKIFLPSLVSIVIGDVELSKNVIIMNLSYVCQAVITFIIGVLFSYIYFIIYRKNYCEKINSEERELIKEDTSLLKKYDKKFYHKISFTLAISLLSIVCFIGTFFISEYYKEREREINIYNEMLITQIVNDFTGGIASNNGSDILSPFYEENGKFFIRENTTSILRRQAMDSERYLKEKKDATIYYKMFDLIDYTRIICYYLLLICIAITYIRKIKNFKIEKTIFLQRASTILVIPCLIFHLAFPIIASYSLFTYKMEIKIFSSTAILLCIGLLLTFYNNFTKILTPAFTFIKWIKNG